MVCLSSITYQEYDKIFHATKPSVSYFHTGLYHQFHTAKYEQIEYLLFDAQGFKLGMIIGSNVLHHFKSPISAPCGGFCYHSNGGLNSTYLYEAIKLLIDYFSNHKIYRFECFMPPSCYDPINFNLLINAFLSNGFEIAKWEVNQYFEVNKFDISGKYMSHSAYKLLNQALKNELIFKICETDKEKMEAYEVIKSNRIYKDKPLRMSFEQLMQSCSYIPNRFFGVYNNNNLMIASAIVFEISATIAQVIYWGNLPEYANLRPMNLLAHQIFSYYAQSVRFKIVDIGISTENGILNHGLFKFKQSLGCDSDPKLLLSWQDNLK